MGKRLAIGLFRMYGATDDDRKYSQKIMDMVTKDSDLRKKNMKIHCGLLLKKEYDSGDTFSVQYQMDIVLTGAETHAPGTIRITA